MVISGTQGEPMSALSRVAVDNHKNLSIEPGDTVVLSSRIIPGNEKAIYRMINHLSRRGADVIYGSMNPPVHVSGHGSAEELKLMLNLVRPQYFMPIHGEYRQLAKHAALAAAPALRRAWRRPSSSRPARRWRSTTAARARARASRWAASASTRARSTRWSKTWSSATAATSPKTASCCPSSPSTSTPAAREGLPEIVSRGFVSAEDGSDLLASGAPGGGAHAGASSTAEERTDWGVMKEKIRADLKRFLTKQTSRRPLIMPVILEV